MHQDPSSRKPVVQTGPATALGCDGASVNGCVAPNGQSTNWYVEFGETTAYGRQTAPTLLPPTLNAHFRESWDDNRSGWGSYGTTMTQHGSQGGRRFVRVSYPCSFDDFNHEGCEVLHLASFVYPGVIENPEESDFGYPSVFLAAGDPDLRNARISISVRGNNWVPNGAELIFLIQSQSNIEVGNAKECLRSNWGFSGCPLTDYLADGKWHQVQYTLTPDTTLWSFGGYNSRERERTEPRYHYWPISQVLQHANCNFFHLLAFVNPDEHPTGSIDFADFELTYRNYSLVHPANGARLLAAPTDGDDPDLLTDGWRHGDGHQWRSAANPRRPQEFTYRLAGDATIDAVQVHQNPADPAKDIEVQVSQDGTTFDTVVQATLPEQGEPSDNFAFVLQRDLAAAATHVRLRVLSGYRTEHWGVGEFEVFGSGVDLAPENRETPVTTDLEGLTKGTTYHYRLIAENAAGRSYGPDQTYTTPATSRPVAATGAARNVTAGSARLQARFNPLGVLSEFYFEYGTTKE